MQSSIEERRKTRNIMKTIEESNREFDQNLLKQILLFLVNNKSSIRDVSVTLKLDSNKISKLIKKNKTLFLCQVKKEFRDNINPDVVKVSLTDNGIKYLKSN